MEELSPTWSLQNGSVRNPTIQERHHKETLFPLIRAASRPITESVA
jgi:hypothetical protein